MYQSHIQSKKARSGRFQKKRELELPNEEDDTYFGVVKDMLGNGRVRVFCEDSSLKIARIRGSMRKSRNKTIIEKNDLVIVAPRDFDDKLDIIHKYTLEEVAKIITEELLPEKIYKTLTESEFSTMNGQEDNIIFMEETTNDMNKSSKNEESAVYDINIEELDINSI